MNSIGPISTETIIQNAHTIAVHREIESARLTELKDIEDADRVKQIDNIGEFNALMNAQIMLNQRSFFDLYV